MSTINSNTQTNTQTNDHRTLVIKNYRNFAPFCKGNETDSTKDKEFLTLNWGLGRDEIGGLVTLIGVNNCGKSNLLRALEIYGHKEDITEDDYTDFNYFSNIRPSIYMNISFGAYGNFEKRVFTTTYTGDYTLLVLASVMNSGAYMKYIEYLNKRRFSTDSRKYISEFSNEKLKTNSDGTIITIQDYFHFIYNSFFTTKRNGSGIKLQDFPIIRETISSLLDFSDSIYKNDFGNYTYTFTLDEFEIKDYYFLPRKIFEMMAGSFTDNRLKGDDKISTIYAFLSGLHSSVSMTVQYDPTGSGLFSAKFGYDLSNNVYRYEVSKIKKSDFKCKYSEFNTFFFNLLSTLNCDDECVEAIRENKKDCRDFMEKVLNARLATISDELNDLLNINDKKYKLKIKLETENIVFSITSGNDVSLNIDRQSEGFTWLFNLFFGLIKCNEFKPGDIIVIDEFGNSLNFATIRELTKLLRTFAQRAGITIILATQNPMAIDICHLDEVRLLVPRDNGSTHIYNKFHDFGIENSHDVLAPVLSGLTISRNFMRTENRKTIFVEGMTDYFYLNGFCEALRQRGWTIDIDFIPINGLGGRKQEDKERTISQICSIESYPIIFTDGDHAGEIFKEIASSNKRVITCNIADIIQKPGVVLVEHLFTQTDAEKLGIITRGNPKPNKEFNHAVCISHKLPSIYDDLEKDTRSNFETIVNYLKSL